MIVDHLTENGAMAPALLYLSPYTDHPTRVGPALQHDVFAEFANAILEHEPQLVLQPLIQFASPRDVLHRLDAMSWGQTFLLSFGAPESTL